MRLEKRRFRFLYLLLIVYGLLGSACNENKQIEVPDVTDIEVAIELTRLDSIFDLGEMDNVLKGLNQLKKEHPEFYELYFTRVLPIDGPDMNFNESLDLFLSDEGIAALIDTVQLVYPHLDDFKGELTKALQFYQYYFPNATIPNFYSLITEFAQGVFIFEDGVKDGVGISLDLFLGKDYPYKRLDPTNPAFSNYLTRTYSKEYLVKRILELLLEDRFGTAKANNLLEQMVEEGKKKYILKRLLPYDSDAILMDYTEEQMNWVDSNELEIWSFFLEKELLYESKVSKTFKYMNPSPSSPGMPKEAPGQTGKYVGWKIVEKHMKKNPNISMNDLMELKDYQKMLKSYKPSRKS